MSGKCHTSRQGLDTDKITILDDRRHPVIIGVSYRAHTHIHNVRFVAFDSNQQNMNEQTSSYSYDRWQIYCNFTTNRRVNNPIIIIYYSIVNSHMPRRVDIDLYLLNSQQWIGIVATLYWNEFMSE